MSPLSWLQRVFAPRADAEEGSESQTLTGFEEESPFVWGQHMRIVIAMLVVFISALVMWWILA